MLNILEGFDPRGLGFGTAEYFHLIAEVLKIGFADRNACTGDPAFVDIPVERLTSKEYAAARRAQIRPDRAGDYGAVPGVAAGSAHTTHVTTADADGNVVAMTQTLNNLFGSKATVPGTGVILNNTMALFDPHPGTPASIAPGKRVTSSMAPTIVLRDGKPAWALGLPGGVRIFTSVFQAVVNLIDHGMTLQEAVEAPRIWSQGQELEMEQDIPAAIRERGGRARPSRGGRPRGRGRDERGGLRRGRHAGGRGLLARRRHAHRRERRPRATGHPLPAGREPAARRRSRTAPQASWRSLSAVVRGALLQERRNALLEVGAGADAVAELLVERLARSRVLGDGGADLLLHRLHRGGAVGGDQLRGLERPRHEPIGGDDAVDEAEARGLRGVDAAGPSAGAPSRGHSRSAG